MPTYEYECRACGHAFELFQSMSDPVKRKCPKCGKPKLERLIGTGSGILFRGSGFYETDYRSENYKKGAEAEKKPAGSGAPGKSDAKPSGEGKMAESKPAEKSADKKSAESEPKPTSKKQCRK